MCTRSIMSNRCHKSLVIGFHAKGKKACLLGFDFTLGCSHSRGMLHPRGRRVGLKELVRTPLDAAARNESIPRILPPATPTPRTGHPSGFYRALFTNIGSKKSGRPPGARRMSLLGSRPRGVLKFTRWRQDENSLDFAQCDPSLAGGTR